MSRSPKSTPVERALARRVYKERPQRPGVFRVVNTANGRIFLGSALDLHAPLNRMAFELDTGMCHLPDMQADLSRHGRTSFSIEVLETVEPRDELDFDPRRELEFLEQKYLARLDRTLAYNKHDRIRFP